MRQPAHMTREELLAEVDRLRNLNNDLSRMLVGMSDRFQGSAKQIAREAFTKGAQAQQDLIGWVSPLVDNPHEDRP